VGKSASTPINDLIKGAPNFDVNVFTSNEFKVTPSGRTDSPLGAFVIDSTPQELITRSNPDNQATREVINGKSAADNFLHNANFALEGQWAKAIHATISNISPTQPITISIDQAKLALMPGFDLIGTGITHVAGSNTWTIDPSLISATGFDFKVAYDIDTRINPVTVNFVADVNIKGTSGPFSLDYTKQIYFTYRNVDANTADFTVTDPLTGKQMFVLPSKGLGVDIRAGAGDDVINAGAGNDWINGGEGADTVNGGTGRDTIIYSTSTAGVEVDLRVTTAQVSTGDASGDVLTSIENITGSNFDDRLTGSEVSNVLKGLDGNDVLVSVGSNDTLDGGDGNDTASYEFSNNAIDASLRSNTSSNGDKLISIENLTGSAFDDNLEGNASANQFDGGLGVDTVTYANAPLIANSNNIGVVASLSGYSFTNGETIVASGDATGDTFTVIENLTGSAFNDTLIGDENNNTLKGGAGNDTLEGLAGADKLIGGLGNDTASYDHANAAVTADLSGLFFATNLQQGDAQGDTFDSIENLTGSKFNDTLIGDVSNNIINAGDGNDVLEGLGGADTFIGGEGTDTVTYINSTGGVRASLTNNLSFFDSAGDAIGDTFDSIENITGSNFSDALFGNSGANILNGGDGSDFLQGLGGGDTYIGGTGIDTVSYARADDNTGVIANLLTGLGNAGFANSDTYNTVENLIGTNWDDELIGDNNANTLTGGLGNDILRGNGGADNISGGDGNDEIYDDLNSATVIDAGAGDDEVYISGADTATDSINGGDGIDTLIWQDGRSIFFNMSTGAVDMVGATAQTKLNAFENFTNEGTVVTATAGWSSWIRASNVDNIITGSASRSDIVDFSNANSAVFANIGTALPGTTSFTANSVSNVDTSVESVDINSARGGSGNDILINIDSLIGSAHNDVLIGNDTVNWLNGSGGNDRLYGFAGNDTLEGGAGNDYLEAGDGNDSLDGGAGADTIDGGADNDNVTYANSNFGINLTFSNASSATGTGGHAQGDQLSNIENVIGSAHNDSFTLVANSLPTSINGGAGTDTIKLSGLTTSLYDLTPVANISTSIERIDISGSGNNNIGLSAQDIINLLDSPSGVTGLPTLTILANSGDTITLDAGLSWAGGTTPTLSNTYLINSGSTAVAAITWQVA
jgi:Ca2+-binding RTX toxin-like protein